MISNKLYAACGSLMGHDICVAQHLATPHLRDQITGVVVGIGGCLLEGCVSWLVAEGRKICNTGSLDWAVMLGGMVPT